MLGQARGRNATRDTLDNLDNGRTLMSRSRPAGSGEQVEDRATAPATIIKDRVAMPIMGSLRSRKGMPLWAAQPVRMQDSEQEVVAGAFVTDVDQQQVLHWLFSVRS